jgi:hypothetical protein
MTITGRRWRVEGNEKSTKRRKRKMYATGEEE